MIRARRVVNYAKGVALIAIGHFDVVPDEVRFVVRDA